MSMFSDIDAERDRDIVKEAIDKAKAELSKAKYSRTEVEQILNKLWCYCEVNICE
jgi:hypothetical protein